MLWVWLAAGVALFLHDLVTGGGVVGYLLYRELLAYHAMQPILTYLGVAMILFGIPGFILLPPRRFGGPPTVETPAELRAYRTGALIVAALLGAFAAYAWTRTQAVPTARSPIARIALDGLGPELRVPSGARIVVRGEPQEDQAVSYDEVSRGRYGPDHHHPHNYVPITETGWTRGQPVRIIGDLSGQTDLESEAFLRRIDASEPADLENEHTTPETQPGLLAPGLPGYLRLAFADRGVTLAPRVWLYMADIDTARKDWEAASFAAGLFAALAVFIAALSSVYLAFRGRAKSR